MGKEIERKFLVKGDAWRSLAKGKHYRQGYLNSAKERTVRIRTIDDKAFLTVKGPTVGVTRLEFEYPISFEDCTTMLDQLAEKPIIEKTRYKIPIEQSDLVIELDLFHAPSSLIMAEVEFPDEESANAFIMPDWFLADVTNDPAYHNSNMATAGH